MTRVSHHHHKKCARGFLLGDWKDNDKLISDKSIFEVIFINNLMVAARVLIASKWKSECVQQQQQQSMIG